MSLEVDHFFCFVSQEGEWLAAIERAGLLLDEGTEHAGQGTRNRRLPFSQQFLELIWLSSRSDAERNPLRLERRADWRRTGASPLGIGLRGILPLSERPNFWSYEPPYAPGFQLLIHRDNAEHPERPLLFVVEAEGDALERMRTRMRNLNPAVISRIEIAGPGGDQQLLNQLSSPLVVQTYSAQHHMRVIVGGERSTLRLDETLELIY